MKRASRFNVPSTWKAMLSEMQIDPQTVLTYAGLPADLFNRYDSSLAANDYYRLWRGMEKASNDGDIPLLLAQHFKSDSFDAATFASLCSQDLNTALNRLRTYKTITGPMVIDIEANEDETHLFVSCSGHKDTLPKSLGMCEMVFFTQLARIGTRERICPIAVTLPELPEQIDKYEKYFGCQIHQAAIASIRFNAEDASKPFLAANTSMWAFYPDTLSRKLADLDANATTTERTRSVLMEALPSGNSSVDFVAGKLAMSKRTLQRKLTNETGSYQTVLTGIRADLADHYLKHSNISLAEIAFLLAFSETNSFIRAYSGWKGISPGQYREQLKDSYYPITAMA